MSDRRFLGSKGGGGGSQPTRTPDTLRSEDTVEVILGISEGEIAGLEDGAKSFLIGETPLENQNGDVNYKAFELNVLRGTEIPDAVKPKLGGTGQSTTVNTRMDHNVPIVRTTTSGNINALEIRLNFQRLMKYDDKGGTHEHKARFALEYKKQSDTEWSPFFGSREVEIKGKTTSAYIKEYRVRVDPTTEDKYEIRVTKLSPNSDTDKFVDIAWESFQEIIVGEQSYPNTALVHLLGRASDQFSSIPQFAGIYKGRVVKVPSNYDPETKSYAGFWDGTFKIAWTDNPAWILYDFVTNDRFGINSYYLVSMDKYDVYEAGRWCDEYIDDGRGGLEPRYTFNSLISQARNGKEMARYIAGTFNAAIFDDLNGNVHLKVDKAEQAVALFTPENVVDGLFEYSYTDLSSRYNDITVTFTNPKLNWAEDRRRVFDQAHIDKFGRIPLDFAAVGCIKDSEAIRRAKYKLSTSLNEIESVNFKTNRQGRFIQPFDIILVADPDMEYAVSGRIKAQISATEIELMEPVYLEAGVEYTFQVQTPTDVFITRVSNTGTETSQLTLDDPLPADTPENAVFSVGSRDFYGLPKPYRVLRVEEGNHVDDFSISALEIDRAKWDYIDQLGGLDDEVPGDGDQPRPGEPGYINHPPRNCRVEQQTRVDASGTKIDLSFEWDDSLNTWRRGYRADYSRDGSPFQTFGETKDNQAVLQDVPHGEYILRVYTIDLQGNLSEPCEVSTTVGAQAPTGTAGINGLEICGQGNDTIFDTRDVKFCWRAVSETGSWELGDEPRGADSGFMDGTFRDFLVEVFDPETDNVLLTDTTFQPTYTFSFEQNARLEGGPYRRFGFRVYARDTYNRQSVPAFIVVENPAPAVPDINVTVNVGSIMINTSAPNRYEVIDGRRVATTDFAGMIVWRSTDPDFEVGPETLVYDGPNNVAIVNADPSVTYYFRVAHYDVFGKVDLNISEVFEAKAAYNIDTTPPEMVEGLTLTSTIDDNNMVCIEAEWAESTAEDFNLYHIDIKQGEGASWIRSVSDDNRFTWCGLQQNTEYCVRVRAHDGAGNRGAWSDTECIVTAADTTPPGIPQGLTVKGGIQSIWLNWINPEDGDLKHIEVQASTGGDWEEIATTPANALVHKELERGLNYCYRVRAVDLAGNVSDWSEEACAATGGVLKQDMDPGAPDQITGLVLSTEAPIGGDGSASARLIAEWTPSTADDLSRYEVAVQGEGGNWTYFDAGEASWDTSVVAGQNYCVKVRAVDFAANKGVWSEVECITGANDTEAPAAPTDVETRGSIHTIWLTWTNPADADLKHIEIEISENSAGPWEVIGTTSADSFVLKELERAKTYYFRLRAVDFSGNTSDWTSAIVGTTGAIVKADMDPGMPDASEGLTLSYTAEVADDGGTNATLIATWDASTATDLSHYEVAVRSEAGDWVYSDVGEPSFERSVKAGKTYVVKVRAVDFAPNKGPWSAEVSIEVGGDDSAPGVVRNLRAIAGFRTIWLEYEAPEERDVSGYEIWESLTTSRANASLLARTDATTYARTDIDTAQTRHYWVRAYDRSGNLGPYSNRASDTSREIEEYDIDVGAIRARHITTEDAVITGTAQIGRAVITDANIADLKASKLFVPPGDDGLPPELTIGTSGTSIGQLTDPAQFINENVTRINPGLIEVFGDTTLADWRSGGDQTKIDGGNVAANSVKTNSLTVGNRGLTIEGLQFSYDKENDILKWTAGQISYIQDDGTPRQVSISAGNRGLNGNPAVYVYWRQGRSYLQPTYDITEARGEDRVVMATYRGGVDLVANYGRTIIDGSQIVTHSVRSNQLVTNEAVITGSAQIADAIIDSAHVLELTAEVLKSGTQIANTITVNGDALGSIQESAADPAQAINANTTQIDPGLIQIAGDTSLSDWRSGTDLTKIDGGNLSANSVKANVVEIGSRNLGFEGIEFGYDKDADRLTWTRGRITYTRDNGQNRNQYISRGNAQWTGGTLYAYWIKDSSSIQTTTDYQVAKQSDRVVLATYRGGIDLVANYGRTIIDGSQIVTNSIRSNQLVTNEAVITGSAQIAEAIIDDAHIKNLQAGKIFVPAGGDGFDPMITVGRSGTTIGDMTDPAGLINSNTTRIRPGLVEISGDTTLDDWRSGTDSTRIEGGFLATNSVKANSLTIGNRNVNTDIRFYKGDYKNYVYWTSGYIETGEGSVSISEGSSSISSKTYIYWRQGENQLRRTSYRQYATGDDKILLCTCMRSGGQVFINAHMGVTEIDGSSIRTQTLHGDRIIAGSITAYEIDVATVVTAENFQGGTFTGGNLEIGGDNLIISSFGQNIVVRDDTNCERVKLGKLGWGPQDYGLEIKDNNCQTIISATGLGLEVADTAQLKPGAASEARFASFGYGSSPRFGWKTILSINVPTEPGGFITALVQGSATNQSNLIEFRVSDGYQHKPIGEVWFTNLEVGGNFGTTFWRGFNGIAGLQTYGGTRTVRLQASGNATLSGIDFVVTSHKR